MKRPILSMLLSVLLLLPGCAQAPSGSSQEEGLTVLATTYPVYLFARTVAQGVEGVTVERLNTGSVSCLHDYTLSVDDMKKIEGADVIAMNGAGLEDFMDDALAASSAAVIDCSQGWRCLKTRTTSTRRETVATTTATGTPTTGWTRATPPKWPGTSPGALPRLIRTMRGPTSPT